MITLTRVSMILVFMLLVLDRANLGALDTGTYPVEFYRDLMRFSHDALDLKQKEKDNPQQAALLYQELLNHRPTSLASYETHQNFLRSYLSELQESSGYVQFTADISLGFPHLYARELLGRVHVYEGLGRTHMAQGKLTEAEKNFMAVVEIIGKYAQVLPATAPAKLRDAHHALEEVHGKQGQLGKALIAKLNVDLLTDHLASEQGAEDFYLEKEYLFGKKPEKQWQEVEKYIDRKVHARRSEDRAKSAAMYNSLMSTYATLEQMKAASALASSGGVLTPDVMKAQNDALIAQMQSQLVSAMTSAQASSGLPGSQVSMTPWSIPSFGQQLVDPKYGEETPAIMNRFATSAVQVGGTSFQAGAQQMTQQVDALMPYRQSGNLNGAAAQVEKFAEVFNAFLTQVQEIKK